MARTPASSKTDKSLAELVSELWALVVAYAKQETVDPLKNLARFAKYGLAGSMLVGIGFLLLALAGLRALQLETSPHWTGSWSWLPYVLTVLGASVAAVALAWRITADKRKADRQRRRAQKGA